MFQILVGIAAIMAALANLAAAVVLRRREDRWFVFL